MPGISANNQRIAKNTMFLYIRMFFVLIVSLYTSRIILNCLGVSDFGIYNVVSGFVSLFGFLNATLASCMQRFYNFELAKNGVDGIKNVYSTGLWIHVIISIFLLFLLESAGVWYINSVMNLPDDRLFAANCIFQAASFSMITVILQIPYLGAILAYEKMDVYSFVSIIEVVMKLGIVLMLPYLPYDRLIAYSYLLLLVSTISLISYAVYAKFRLQGIKLEYKINHELFKRILSFSGWNLIGTFAFMTSIQGQNLILNSFFGTVVNAARGISYQVSEGVTTFTSNITTSFRPQIVDAYAKQIKGRVLSLFYTETKICYTLILLLIIPLIAEIDYVLSLWLGSAIPSQTNIFTILVLVNVLISTMNPIIGQVTFATGKIKRYQIANSMVNILVLPASWLVLDFGYSAVSVFIVTIIFSIINQIVCITELNRVFNIAIKHYILSVVMPCFISAILLMLPQHLLHMYIETSFIRLIIAITTNTILVLLLSYCVVLNSLERKQVIGMLYDIRSKIISH